MAFWSSLGFQNFLNLTSYNLKHFHNVVLVWLIFILTVVLIVSSKTIFSYINAFMSLESTTLEITWTCFPMLILVLVAYPSLNILNSQDSLGSFRASFVVKLIANQWNWQSESLICIDHLIDDDSYDKPSSYDLPLILPFGKITSLFITSSDVLHSLGIPCLGVKLDAIPGRLNSIVISPFNLGVLLGSCYELCGSGHSMMPLTMLVTD